MKPCSFPGCERKHEAKGLCKAHYRQKLRGQEPRPLGRSPCRPSGEWRDGRPLCGHGEPMRLDGNGPWWRCVVRERELARKRKRWLKEGQTPGTYKYKAYHGIGLPGLAIRMAMNRQRRNRANAHDLETIAKLTKELISLG